MKIIDLRSDTVTRPTTGMRAAMMNAVVGDDVFGDDPTVNALQEKMADMVGMEAALFLPSGTQSNLCALMAHCARGDEYIVGQSAHTYKYEGGGAAVLGSIQPQPIENAADGTIPLDKIRAAVKPDDSHFAITRLIALENTIGGQVIAEQYLADVRAMAKEKYLAMHLDGARLFNAAVKTKRTAKDICTYFDSVSICLSKGLGAPAGSVLCGTKNLIKRAQRYRKMLGGGMRQSGFIAAAGIYALEHHIERLQEDHDNAVRLANGLMSISPQSSLTLQMPETNILFVDVSANDVPSLQAYFDNAGVKVIIGARTRLVTHLDVTTADVDRVINVFQSFYRGRA